MREGNIRQLIPYVNGDKGGKPCKDKAAKRFPPPLLTVFQ